jgi:hypothetical protein
VPATAIPAKPLFPIPLSDESLMRMRRVLARHRRMRYPHRLRCAWCHQIWPCAARRTAEAAVRAAGPWLSEQSVPDVCFGDLGERFPLGRPFGALPSNGERITDSEITPYGLRLRVRPATPYQVDLTAVGYDEKSQTGTWPETIVNGTRPPTVINTNTTTDGANGPDSAPDHSRDTGWD